MSVPIGVALIGSGIFAREEHLVRYTFSFHYSKRIHDVPKHESPLLENLAVA